MRRLVLEVELEVSACVCAWCCLQVMRNQAFAVATMLQQQQHIENTFVLFTYFLLPCIVFHNLLATFTSLSKIILVVLTEATRFKMCILVSLKHITVFLTLYI